MRFLILLLAGIATANTALALEKTFTWTAPTAYTDGTPLPAADIAGYTITCGARVLTVNGPVTSYRADFTPGAYVCSAQTRAVNGTISLPSMSVNFSVPQPVPNAPGAFSVN